VILVHWSFFDVDPHYLMGKLTFDANLMRGAAEKLMDDLCPLALASICQLSM
jgi:hypothetical protein